MANPAIVKQSLTPPDFTELGARKLADLLEKGFVITGYCFERQVDGTQPQRGFVDFAGVVGWHQPSAAPMTAIQELSWCGNCGEGVTFFCRSKTVCECPKGLGRVTAHGVADMKGGQDVDA